METGEDEMVEKIEGDPDEKGIFIWLQNSEEEGRAMCGCVLYRRYLDDNPAFIMCEKHLGRVT
jgi:hypothetical protein